MSCINGCYNGYARGGRDRRPRNKLLAPPLARLTCHLPSLCVWRGEGQEAEARLRKEQDAAYEAAMAQVRPVVWLHVDGGEAVVLFGSFPATRAHEYAPCSLLPPSRQDELMLAQQELEEQTQAMLEQSAMEEQLRVVEAMETRG